jgi:autotransporter-associated beta strand protein
MKAITNHNSNAPLGRESLISTLAMCGVLLVAANSAFGQLNGGTARTWTGGGNDYKFGTAANWTGSVAPASGSGDIAIWDTNGLTGNVAGNVLQVTNAASNSSNPGMTLQVTGNHTNGLGIVSTGSGNPLRLGTNSLVIASGSGPVSLGNGGTSAFQIALVLGAGSIDYFTNNSSYPATINSDVYFVMGGGNPHYITMCGSGGWNLYNQWDPNNTGSGGSADQMIIDGTGTVTYAPTNAPGITFPAGGFQGITLNSGTFKLGNSYCLTNLNGTLTLNGGTFDINGFSITNNLSGGANIDTSAVGGTPVLTVSNASSTTFSGVIKNTAGTLSLAKYGAGTLTLSGANTYSGTTTVNAGTLLVNGSIGSGAVTVASGTTLGGWGTIGGSVTWQSGSSALFTVTNSSGVNALPLTISGSASLINNSVTINVPGSTALPVGTYTLMNASGGSSGQFVTSITSANYTGAGVAAGTLSSISTSGGVATLTVVRAGVTGVWTNDLAGGTGNWSVATNWLSNTIPSVAGDTATLGVGSEVSTVTLDTNISLGGITYTNPNSFIIAAAGKTLTLDNKGGGATIAVNSGTSNSIAPAVSLNDKATINVAGNMSLTVGGIISSTGGTNTLTKTGSGTLILSANNTYGPAAGSIGTVLGGGTLELPNSQALGTGDVTNSANSTMQLDTAMTLANKIWINSASALTLNDGGNAVILTGGFGGAGTLTKTSAGYDIITNNGISTLGNINITTNGVMEIAPNTTINATASGGGTYVDNGGTLQVDSGAVLNVSLPSGGYYAIGNTTGTISTNIINGTLNWGLNAVVGRNGGGMLIINSGQFSCNQFYDGQATTADSGYVYLNGGTLLVTNVVVSGSSVNYFYFNGGTLAAKGNNADFWDNNIDIYAYVESNPGTVNNNGYNIAISQPINSETGTDGGMIFNGAGVTTLTGANGYNGPTAVNNGTLLVNGSIGSGNVTVANNAAFGGSGTAGGNVTWQTGSSASFVVTNTGGGNGTPLSVSGSVTLNNNSVKINVLGSTPLPVGTYTLMNAGGNSGQFVTNLTSANFTGAGVAGGTVSTVSVSGGTATLTVSVGGNTWTHDGNGNWSTAADWSGNPVIPRLPGDTALFGVGSAFITVTLDTNVSVGSISFTNPNSFFIANAGKTLTLTNSLGNLAINVSAGQSNSIAAPVVLNGTVLVSASSDGVLGISGGISGPGGLNIDGDGTGMLTLSGSNTYSGVTTVNAATLVFASTNAIGTNTLTLNGCNLDSSTTNLVNVNNNPQIWLGDIGFIGSDNLNLGTGNVTVSNNLTISVTNELVVGGNINAGSLTVTLEGNGTLELDGNNTFGIVNSGVNLLLFGNDYAAGTGTLNSYSPSAYFASSSSATRTIHNILGAGNGTQGWNFSGTGNLVFDGGVTSYNYNKTVTVNNPVTTWNFELPSGAASTTLVGTGTFVLAGANANTGGNIVTGGTLALANSGALGTGPLTMNGGNLDCLVANLTNINDNAETWNTNFTFLGSQNLNLGTGDVTMAGNVTVTVSANTLTVGGAIGDGGSGYSLTSAGSGTLALDGANTYTGNTVIEAGTLLIGDPGTLNGGSYAGQITNNGTFNYGSSTAQTLSGVISGTGSLIQSGSGLLTLSGNNTYTGNTIIQVGTLELVNPVLYTNSAVAISNGAAIQLDFSVTNSVGALVLNGVTKPAGVYGSSTPGGYITGNGFLQVASSGPSGPAHLTNSVSGSTLSLTWPAGQGWRLQMQTNSLLSTNWVYVTDGSISSTNITIYLSIPKVFYRLTYP